jgi:FeS assembly SUF system protein
MPGQEEEMDDHMPKLDIADDQAVHHAWTPDGEVAPPTSPEVSEDAVIEAISTVYDPEIPVNIFELGLIYAIDIADDGNIKVEMTLTAPGCPSAQELPVMVREAILAVPGVTGCDVETVWDPPWDMSRMSDEARLAMNMF